MKSQFCVWTIAASVCAARALAQAPVELPAFPVSSERVALEDPVASFSMPVTALRYEPLRGLIASRMCAINHGGLP